LNIGHPSKYLYSEGVVLGAKLNSLLHFTYQC